MWQVVRVKALSRFGVVLLALSMGACGGGNEVDAGSASVDAGARDAGGGTDAGRSDAGVRTDAGSTDAGAGLDGGEVGTDAGVDGGVVPPMGDVRFIVMGDVGEGNAAQSEVAEQIRLYCAVEGCDFVILLGDNIYDSGVDSVTDDQWRTKFEEPYTNLMMPFYPVLGNHDYGGVVGVCPLCTEQGGLGNEFDVGPIEVEYTASSMKWTMPSTFYTFQESNVGFVMLDTNSILWDDTTNGDQLAWYRGAVADLRAAGADWIITSGHHPYRSNGQHGNAGTYESFEVGGVEIPITGLAPMLDGRSVQSFFESYICGDADVSFSGHDHNRQWIDEPTACGGTELIVSGAGAKVKDFSGPTRNATHWQDASTPGFMHVTISGDTFTGRFINRAGTVEYERMFSRTP